MTEFERGLDKWRQLARQAPAGLPLEHLVPGAIVAVSAHKGSGDTSYKAALLEVVAVTGDAVLVKLIHDPDKVSRVRGHGPFILRFAEREWYAAEHLLDALRADTDQPQERSDG